MLNEQFTGDIELDAPRVYIAGPMSGLPNANRSAFNAASVMVIRGDISEIGTGIPLNPAILPYGLSQAEYMQICMQMVMIANVIYVLTGWESSLRAQAEIALAKKLGKRIIYQDCETD